MRLAGIISARTPCEWITCLLDLFCSTVVEISMTSATSLLAGVAPLMLQPIEGGTLFLRIGIGTLHAAVEQALLLLKPSVMTLLEPHLIMATLAKLPPGVASLMIEELMLPQELRRTTLSTFWTLLSGATQQPAGADALAIMSYLSRWFEATTAPEQIELEPPDSTVSSEDASDHEHFDDSD